MHVILWRFRPRPDRETAFVAAYGDDGVWAQFFRTGDGFLGSELLRGTDGVYLTVDRWASKEAYRTFADSESLRYAELDAACSALTIEETLLGEFAV